MEELTNVFENTCDVKTGQGISCKDNVCPEGTSCCQEPNSNIITCCAKGSCGDKTGLCEKPRLQRCPNKKANIYENYVAKPKEKKNKFKFTVVNILIGLLILTVVTGIVVLGLNKWDETRKQRNANHF